MVYIRRTADGNIKDKSAQGSWLATSLGLQNFLPGLIIGFLLGLFVELPKRASPSRLNILKKKRGSTQPVLCSTSEELKMVFVVRQDLKMGSGKIASQCAHAAVGIYEELMQRYCTYEGGQIIKPKHRLL